jgi:hypothetical protein
VRLFAQPRGRRRQGPREYHLAEHCVFGAKRVLPPSRVRRASTTQSALVGDEAAAAFFATGVVAASST